jgi:hypothetical protein
LTLALEEGEGSASPPGRTLPPGKTRYPLYRECGWALGSVWAGEENFTTTGIRSPDRPARRQLLYRLHHPAHRAPNIPVEMFSPLSESLLTSFGVVSRTILRSLPSAPLSIQYLLNILQLNFMDLSVNYLPNSKEMSLRS